MSKKKLSGRALAVQLGREEIRIARLTLGAAMPQLQGGRVIPTPPGAVEDGFILDPEMLRGALKAALADPEYRRYRNVVFCLCSTQVVSDTARIPPLKGRRLEKMLETNADLYFPMAAHGSRLTWMPIGTETGPDGHEELAVQMWAAPEGLLSRYYELANQCGLSVSAIDYCGNSMASILDAGFARPAGAGKRKQMARARGGAGKKRRKQNGEEELSAAMATAVMEMPEADEAPPGETKLYLLAEEEHLLLTFVRDGQVAFQRLLLRGAEGDELGEARLALEFYRGLGNNRYGDIEALACGAAADAWYIGQAGQVLGLPVRAWSFQQGSEWSLCLGASRTRLDFGVPAMNHPGGGRSQLSQAWQYGLLLAGGALLTVCLLVTFGSRRVWDSTLTGLASQEKSLQLQAAKNDGSAQRYHTYLEHYEAYSSDWDTLLGTEEAPGALRTYNDNLVKMLEELETVLPKTVSVTSIGIANEGLGLQFACPSKEEAAYLIIALRELEYASLDAISNLTVGPGATAQEMLPSLNTKAQAEAAAKTQADAETEGTEEPPSKGSLDINSLLDSILNSGASSVDEALQYALDQGLDLETLMDSLTTEQLLELESVYGTTPRTSYSLSALLAEATFSERKAALTTMLTNDPIAILLFFGVLQEDAARPVDEKILFDYLTTLENMELLGNIMSALSTPDDLDVEAVKQMVPALLQICTENEETLSATEELIQTDTELSKRYAYYLAVEMDWQEPEKGVGTIDEEKIKQEIASGKLSSALSEETSSAVENVVKDVVTEAIESGSIDIGSLTGGSGNSSNNQAIMDWFLQNYGNTENTGTGTEGTTGGETAEPEDTRIYFAVALGYKEALIREEQMRKGLDAGDKVEKLEVTP